MGKMIILGGPSSSGKSTLQTMLLDRFRPLVTVTTRPPRTGEVDGVHYYFISVEEYDRCCDIGEMPEQTVYAGTKYGVYRKTLDQVTASEQHTLAVMDNVGVDWMKGYFGEDQVIAIHVGISEETMRQRLIERGSSVDEIERRVKQAVNKEMTDVYKSFFDHHVSNEGKEINETLQEVLAILENYISIL